MQSRSILILGLCWFYCYSVINSKECTKATFERGTEDSVTRKYSSEWGGINYLFRICTGGSDDFPISEDAKKALCACAIFKRNGKYDEYSKREYENILSSTVINREDEGRLKIPITYCGRPWDHPTPTIECSSGGETIYIAKGYKKKSLFSQEYDIYVGKVENGKWADFQGIIKNVDVK